MCIFTGEVESVSKTQIFSCKNSNRQVVVYGNKVELDKGKRVAMVLPVPSNLDKKDGGIEVLDMSRYNNLFDDLDSLFPKVLAQSFARGLSDSLSLNSYDEESIDVKHVGSYKVSIVPSFNDFQRLQFSEFELDPNVVNLLNKHYKEGYGFVVCIIKENCEFHPIAYSHDITSTSGQFFLPTRHYHGESHKNKKPDWDHSIYVMGNREIPLRHLGCRVESTYITGNHGNYSSFNSIDVNRLPFNVNLNENLTRLTINDSCPYNADLVFV